MTSFVLRYVAKIKVKTSQYSTNRQYYQFRIVRYIYRTLIGLAALLIDIIIFIRPHLTNII